MHTSQTALALTLAQTLALAPPATGPQGRGDGSGRMARGTCTLLPGVGSLQELMGLLGMAHRCCDRCRPDLRLPVMRLRPTAVLLHEGALGHTLYVVRSGSFKCVRTREDGYERVLSFAHPGELLGYESLHKGIHQSSALALDDSTVYALLATDLYPLQQRCPILDEAVRNALSRQLGWAAESAEMMSAVAAEARLGHFILWLSARTVQAGQSPHRFRLRMARRDIASLLGLAHETVSRCFTTLSEAGCLRVENREVEILDLQALLMRTRSTRGPHGCRLARQ